MDVPKIPKKGKNQWVWYAGGGVAVVAIVIMYRKSSASSAAAAASTSPVGADYSGSGLYDPNADYSGAYTGYGGGTATGLTPSGYSWTDPVTGTVIGGGGSGSSVVAPANNGQWAQQAEAYLAQQGYDPITVTAALGKYLTGQNLTNDQLGIVQTAIAFMGNPPTPVAPPHIAPQTGQPKPTTGGGTQSGRPYYIQDYTSIQGDTLTTIAQRTYGSATGSKVGNWYSIWGYNKFLSPVPTAKIKVGTHIRIPHAAT